MISASATVLFVSAFLNTALGVVVLLRKATSVRNISFALLSFGVSLWSIGIAVFRDATNIHFVYFSGVMVHFAAGLAIYSLLPFSFTFPSGNLPRRLILKRAILYINGLILLSTLIPGFVVKNVSIGTANGENAVAYGLGFLLFSVYVFVSAIWAFYNLIHKYRQEKGITKLQLRYMFLGIYISAIIGIVTNLLLPAIGIFSFNWVGPSSTLIMVSFIAYSIIRHRLLDIRLVVTRSVIYAILVLAVTFSFVFITFISGQLFNDASSGKIIVSVVIAFLIVFGLDPLKRWLSRVTDKVFYQAKIDYAQLLQKLSNVASLELNLQKLIDDLERGVIEGLKVKGALILLRDQEKGVTQKFRATDESGSNLGEIVIDNDSALIQFLREHRHLSLLESLERKIEDTPESSDKKQQEASKAEFMRIGAALVAPIFSQDHLVAILTLGPKLSGDSFSNDDTHLIEVLAPQIGSAIQKANLYEEVREFSEDLKIKVNDATKELRDRNVSLQTLQNITKDITRTLDFNKVVQNIANAVATELGFLGAILIFIDDDGKTLRARAVTETPLTTKAIQLLPKPFSSYTTELTNPKHHTLAFDVITTGEVRYTDSMPEVISPPIPKPIVLAMQKLMGIRTMILVPITSEDRVIGVIEVGAKRKREAISDSEIETIQSMADELGVVARNISLFDRVRRTNDQLEQANAHLKQLDQAKSEFVSIASHQLRTPMTGIMGYLSMMTQGDFGKIKPEHQKILVDLLSESQRMIRLINQFLNVSKIEAGKFTYTWKPTQIEDLVEHVAKEVEKAAADKGLKLSVKYPKTKLPQIQADSDKVEDVILNLLDNAIKYTAKGTVTATVALEDGRMHFAVKDSGIGIKPQDATELFNKFVRGSGIAQIHPDGSGLGLFIAKSIIDAHGGRIWAESDGEGKGSTFQFSLPMKPPADEPAPLNPAAHVVGESTRPS